MAKACSLSLKLCFYVDFKQLLGYITAVSPPNHPF